MKNLIILFFVFIHFSIFGQNVYTTKSGEKYHKESCHYLNTSKNEIEFNKAIELGYAACKVCKPSSEITSNVRGTSLRPTTTNKAATNSGSQQCTGRTKAGARCKRITKSSSGRCYQH